MFEVITKIFYKKCPIIIIPSLTYVNTHKITIVEMLHHVWAGKICICMIFWTPSIYANFPGWQTLKKISLTCSVGVLKIREERSIYEKHKTDWNIQKFCHPIYLIFYQSKEDHTAPIWMILSLIFDIHNLLAFSI